MQFYLNGFRAGDPELPPPAASAKQRGQGDGGALAIQG